MKQKCLQMSQEMTLSGSAFQILVAATGGNLGWVAPSSSVQSHGELCRPARRSCTCNVLGNSQPVEADEIIRIWASAVSTHWGQTVIYGLGRLHVGCCSSRVTSAPPEHGALNVAIGSDRRRRTSKYRDIVHWTFDHIITVDEQSKVITRSSRSWARVELTTATRRQSSLRSTVMTSCRWFDSDHDHRHVTGHADTWDEIEPILASWYTGAVEYWCGVRDLPCTT